MENWIPFAEGEYLVDQALLMAADHKAVQLEDAVVEVYSDRRGRRYLRGRGRVRNALLIELLEDSDRVDLLLDFGAEFKYLLQEPNLQGGKVFAPDVRSVLQFTPQDAWRQMPPDEFKSLCEGLQLLIEH
jgi:hypothetical protein